MSKINIVGNFSTKMPLKNFSNKVLLDDNKNFLMKVSILGREQSFHRFQILHFCIARVLRLLKFFYEILSILKTTHFNFSENA